MFASIVLGLIALASIYVTIDFYFLAHRRWMKRHGNGREYKVVTGAEFFSRQYKINERLRSYGENPTGKDNS